MRGDEEMWEYLRGIGRCHLFREVGTKLAYALTEDEYEELKQLNPGVDRFVGEVTPGTYFIVTKDFLKGECDE